MNRVKTVLIHFGLWALYISLAISAYSYGGDFRTSAYETTVSYLVCISFFYLHSEWILPRFFEKRKFKYYSLMFVVLYAYCLGIKYFLAYIFDPWLFNEPSSASFAPPGKFFIVSTIQWLNFTAFSTGYWFLKMSSRNSKKAREKEKVELENIALRAKLNPHFLFNVLESFRIECGQILPNLSRAIGSLIFIIRSSVIEPGPDGMIPLKREVKSIQSYISIFKSRFPEHNIGFSQQIFGDRNYRILPHILLEFVENALKYGDYKDENNKIDIRLKVINESLHFKVRNRKRGNISTTLSTGMGLKNIKKLLETGYPDTHDLSIIDSDDFFEVQLFVKNLVVENVQNLKSKVYEQDY